jgi:hypothetical protein
MPQKNSGLQIISTLLLLLPATICAQSDDGIGINMDSAPIGAFHLDARLSTASSNLPDNNALTAAQQADDVVVSTEGHTGIGTIYPTARLTVNTQGASGVFPIRMKDGSEMNGNIIVSLDSEGHASWQAITPPAQDVVYPIKILDATACPQGTSKKIATSELKVTENGFYSVDVRWWVMFDNTSTSALQKSVTRFQLRRNDVVVDEIKYHEVCYQIWTAFFVMYATAEAGDEL